MSFFADRIFFFALLLAYLISTSLPILTKVLLSLLLVREFLTKRGNWFLEQAIILVGECYLLIAISADHIGLIGVGLVLYTISFVFLKRNSAFYHSYKGTLQSWQLEIASAISRSSTMVQVSIAVGVSAVNIVLFAQTIDMVTKVKVAFLLGFLLIPIIESLSLLNGKRTRRTR